MLFDSCFQQYNDMLKWNMWASEASERLKIQE